MSLCGDDSVTSASSSKSTITQQQQQGTVIYNVYHEHDLRNESPSTLYGKNEILLGCGKGKGREQDDEAELPRPFEYFEDEDEPKDERDDRQIAHVQGPLPNFSFLDAPPEDLRTLEPLEYYPLNPEVNPIRLLVLLPHFGNPYSVVQCNLFPVLLQEHHYCFAAIIRTRGNKTVTSNIIVNGQVKQITRNLEVFLRHFRKENHAVLIWAREICIDAGDVPYHLTPEWRDWVFNNACRKLSMPDLMELLEERGILEKERQITIRQKAWSKIIRWEAPTHFPIPLRTFENIHIPEESIIPIPHEYVPLDLVAEEIRLVVLLPAKNRNDPLYAHFAHESIYGNVSYLCLSYTWGIGEATSVLILNGMTFPIRKNLEDALRDIRDDISTTTIWIDAICIDQQNVRERSRQVSRMHQIYENADSVLVWLGEADEDSDLALDFIARRKGYDSMYISDNWEEGEAAVPRPFEYFENPMEDDETESAPALTNENIAPSVDKPDDGKETLERDFQDLTLKDAKKRKNLGGCWAAIYRLLQRPYFRRMWVVQEIAAASLPTVWCGRRRIAWSDLHSACLELMSEWESISKISEEIGLDIERQMKRKEIIDGTKCRNPVHPRYGITIAHRMAYLRQMRVLEKPLSFLFLALLHRESDCTDPRDKIYALWNLANDAGELGIVPDYSLSVRELYISFTKQYILHHGCLDIICAPQVGCIIPVEGGLPSWVPDWRTTSHTNGYIRPEILPLTAVNELHDLDAPLYSASRSTKAITGFSNNDELVCGGMLVDTIAVISQESQDPNDWFRMALEHCHESGNKTPEEKVNQAFWSMILGDETSSWEFDKEGGGRVRMSVTRGISKAHKTAQLSYERRSITSNIKGRRFIVTKNGFMGLVPSWSHVGDTLAILFGCNVPVVLGKCNEESTHFHLRGDCFVQGWMRGEVLDALGDVADEAVVAAVVNEKERIQIR
jgi:Heterokaryon incompatibility protein (HET)